MFPAPLTPSHCVLLWAHKHSTNNGGFQKYLIESFLIKFNNHMPCDQVDENKNTKRFEDIFMLSL